jgi:hypothetical protein
MLVVADLLPRVDLVPRLPGEVPDSPQPRLSKTSTASPAAAKTSAKRSRYIRFVDDQPCAITTHGAGPLALSTS